MNEARSSECRVVFHDVRSAYNVGALFRTADGAGVARVYLTGYTPAPIDRFGRAHSEIQKTALGATQTVTWEACSDIDVVLKMLERDGFYTVAVEQHQYAIPYTAQQRAGKVAYIFGNEVTGVPDRICRAVDAIVAIPMYGSKESLNVSVAAGIILYQHAITRESRPRF